MQDLALTVSADGNLSLYRPPGDDLYFSGLPTFSGAAQDWFEQAKVQIRNARDQALADVQPQIGPALKAIPFKDALGTFDAGANVTFVGLEITADGVILRGSTSGMWRRPDAFVNFVKTPDGGALTAFKSWIPAGTIDQFVWSWVIRTGLLPWSGTVKELPPHPHSFIFRWGAKAGQKPWEVSPPPGKYMRYACRSKAARLARNQGPRIFCRRRRARTARVALAGSSGLNGSPRCRRGAQQSMAVTKPLMTGTRCATRE
jgi:hypothetical protein